MDIAGQLILQLVLILLNAFFAATEIAVISLNEKKVRAKAEDGDKKAKKMLKMIEQPTRFLSTIQIGITLAGFLGSAFAADGFATMLSDFIISSFKLSPDSARAINTVSVILITLILSYFTLVLGELVPKRVAMRHKEKLANVVCGIISFLASVLRPVIWFLTASTNGVLRLMGIDPHAKEEPVSEEDIVLMLDAGADEGSLDSEDIEYIKNVFSLDKKTAQDIMTPRRSVVFISENSTDEEIINAVMSEGYSRIPVTGEGEDDIVGIMHSRDYLLKREEAGFKLADILQKPVFVSEKKRLDTLMREMQAAHNHMVVVVNEYGETAGIVTLEDILEEIVGEINDESDEEAELITKLSDNSYKINCTLNIDEFFECFDMHTPEGIKSTTVNGWLCELCGNIPEKGEKLDYEKLRITVTNADEIMSHEITVHIADKEEEEKE